MTEPSPRFCSWGMYAITEPLQTAWRALHGQFLTALANETQFDPVLRFDTGDATLRDASLLLGQTCGYPLVQRYRDTLTPVCVPIFDAQGCSNKQYNSVFIVNKNSAIKTLADCAGQRVAINGTNSNSGMSMLRAAVAPLSETLPFFSQTLISGGHRQSVEMVAKKQADIAAIDCVTYALIGDAWPTLPEEVRVIGYSEKSAGLPFVIATAAAGLPEPENIIDALREALANIDKNQRACLRLRGFESVTLADYVSIERHEERALVRNHRPDDI